MALAAKGLKETQYGDGRCLDQYEAPFNSSKYEFNICLLPYFIHDFLFFNLQEAYFRYMAENPTAGLIPEEEEDNLEYDSDGNPMAGTTKRVIDPLPPMDHSEVRIECPCCPPV